MTNDWKETTLAKICEPISETFDFTGKSKVIFLNTGDILDGRFLHDNFSVVKALPGQAKKTIQFNDILFSEIRPKNKRCALVNFEDTSNYVVSTKLMVIRTRGDVSPQYLYLILTSKETLDYFQILAESRSGTFPQITFDAVSHYKVKLPPLPEQKAIANILGSLDDKIELNQRMNATLEATARAIFKSWFVDFDPVCAKAEGKKPAGMSEDIAKLFSDSFEDSELGKIPKGWKVRTIEDLCCSIENGGTPKRMEKDYWENGNIPWLKTGELADGPLIDSGEKITRLGLENSSCKLWEPGVILIALYASPTVGRLGILEVSGASNQACSALKAKTEYGNQFLFHTLLAKRDYLQQIAVGAAQQNINQQVVRSLEVVIPPPKLAGLFQNTISDLYKLQVNNSKQSQNLASLRDALLPKLLSGEIRVKNAKKFMGESV